MLRTRSPRKEKISNCYLHSNSLSNKMDNSLLAVRDINHKYIVVEKRDYLCGRLEQMGLSHTTPQGSYFVLVDISGFLEKPEFTGWTDLEFCEWMIKNYGVAAVPGSSFFKESINNYIRLHFSRGKETLEAAADRLEKMAKDYGFC